MSSRKKKAGAPAASPTVPTPIAPASTPGGPFVLVNDDSGHWYVIPQAQENRWDRWIGSDAWNDGNVPEYARPVGGSVSRVLIHAYSLP